MMRMMMMRRRMMMMKLPRPAVPAALPILFLRA